MKKIVKSPYTCKVVERVLIHDYYVGKDVLSISIKGIPDDVTEIHIEIGGQKFWSYRRDHLKFSDSFKIDQTIPARKFPYHDIKVCFEYDNAVIKSEMVETEEYAINDDQYETVYIEDENRYVTGKVAKLVKKEKEVFYAMVLVPQVTVETGIVDMKNDEVTFWQYIEKDVYEALPETSEHRTKLKYKQISPDLYMVQNLLFFTAGMAGARYCF